MANVDPIAVVQSDDADEFVAHSADSVTDEMLLLAADADTVAGQPTRPYPRC